MPTNRIFASKTKDDGLTVVSAWKCKSCGETWFTSPGGPAPLCKSDTCHFRNRTAEYVGGRRIQLPNTAYLG